MAGGPGFVRLSLLLLLGFALLSSCLNAIAISTGTRNLMDESSLKDDRLVISDNAHLENVDESWEIIKMAARMNVEVNDYPGSGANNRHKPRP